MSVPVHESEMDFCKGVKCTSMLHALSTSVLLLCHCYMLCSECEEFGILYNRMNEKQAECQVKKNVLLC